MKFIIKLKDMLHHIAGCMVVINQLPHLESAARHRTSLDIPHWLIHDSQEVLLSVFIQGISHIRNQVFCNRTFIDILGFFLHRKRNPFPH